MAYRKQLNLDEVETDGKKKSANNPFYDDDEDDYEVDDFSFLRHPKQGSQGYMLQDDFSAKPNSEWEKKQRQLLDERKQIEERTLQSSNFALGLLHDSEQMGIQTAEELSRQGEQLRNMEHKVDDINSTLRMSQKHLNVMKSIFGGIKSYFSGGSNVASPSTKTYDQLPAERPAASSLTSALENSKNSLSDTSSDHPALKLRGIETSGFAESPEETDESYWSGGNSSSTSYQNHSAMVDRKLDENLDDLNFGLSRLKCLAVGLRDEISEQNETLDRLGNKVERSDITIRNQNKQINKILKK